MTGHSCCAVAAHRSDGDTIIAPKTDRDLSPATRVRRSLGVAGWLVPGVMLALMPKCPACFAAYVAIGTGLGLSITTAANFRIVIIILCIGSLLFFAATQTRRLIVRLS